MKWLGISHHTYQCGVLSTLGSAAIVLHAAIVLCYYCLRGVPYNSSATSWAATWASRVRLHAA